MLVQTIAQMMDVIATQGIGIRCLHHRGVHRRKPDSHKWGPEDELWKRAFWSFIALERMVCVSVGRPISLQVEEYAFNLPACPV